MIVEALGLEASASTWLFNIIRRIVQVRFDRTYAIESTDLASLQRIIEVDGRRLHEHPIPEMDDPDAIIIKGHNCEGELFGFLRLANADFILSVRDPRDAIASMITRLGENEIAWSQDLARSLAAIYTARHAVRNLFFTYEDRFFEDPQTLDVIAEFLQIDLTRDQRSEIFEEFTREKVAKFIGSIEALPENRRIVDHAGRISDRDTMFNRSHVGDARSGKWREVVRPQLHQSIERCFADLAGKKQLAPGTIIRFTEALFKPDRSTNSQTPYIPEREKLKFRLLCMCFLPRGVWRVTIRGALPPARDIELDISQAGESVFSSPISEEDMQNLNISFELVHRRYAHPLTLRITGYDIGFLDPLRPNPVEMEATYIRGV